MPLLYRRLHENGSLELQFTNTLPAAQLKSFLQQPGIKLHQCLKKLTISPTLSGGKGAFRQLMRNVGRTTNKSHNQSMARDLTGRRIRDVENETRLQRWIAGHAEREANRQVDRTKKLEKLAKLSRDEQDRKKFLDASFDEAANEMMDQMDKAVTASFQKDSSESTISKRNKSSNGNGSVSNANGKRSAPALGDDKPVYKNKRPKFGFGEEIFSDSDESGQEEARDDHQARTSPARASDEGVHGVDRSPHSDYEDLKQNLKHRHDTEMTLQELEKTKSDLSDNIINLEKQRRSQMEQQLERRRLKREKLAQLDDEKKIRAQKLAKEESEKMAGALTAGGVASKAAKFKPINIKKISGKGGFLKYESEHLKNELNRRGLKAGGTDEQRIHRLFFVRNLKWDKIPKKFKNPAFV